MSSLDNNGKIFYSNLTGDLVPTTGLWTTTEETGFEKEYLINSNQGVVWRSTDTQANEIRMTFASKTPVYGIVVMNHNLEDGDTFNFQASNDEWTTLLESKTVPWATGFVEIEDTDNWDTSGYYNYRLLVQKNVGTDSYAQIGEIYLVGASYKFDRNFKWGYQYTREINRNSKQTTSGQVYRKTRFVRRGFNLDFEGMSDTQKETFEEISENDYICFLPTGSDGDLYYGTVDFSSFTHVYNNFWDASITFMENPK